MSILLAFAGAFVAFSGALYSFFEKNAWERILYVSMIDIGFSLFMISSKSSDIDQLAMSVLSFYVITDIIIIIIMGKLEISEKHSKIMFRSYPLASAVMIIAVLARVFFPPFPGFIHGYGLVSICMENGYVLYGVFYAIIAAIQLIILFRILRDMLKNLDEIYSYDRNANRSTNALGIILAVIVYLAVNPLNYMYNPFENDYNDISASYKILNDTQKAENIIQSGDMIKYRIEDDE